jgi:multidrug transporter EmrE-like cation transporter
MLLAFLSVALNALAQITIKSLSGLELSFNVVLRSWQLYSTGFLYGASIIAWFFALKTLPLGIAYPLQALGYVLVTVLAWAIFNESLNWLQVLALGVIVVGVLLLSLSASK